ncbi:MAG: hypothetical protein MK060_16870 [Blastomonas sp.]|uniref:hypothetical protein n=1 Tax=Blastomonas sp. TaxID=1909299 RepID=UPI00406A585E|nr:hypothetical protein [Blastomonas sp.]
MCRIPNTVRIAGRYVYRRRVHFQNIISKTVTLALQTADPSVARRRAALLSARFVIVKMNVEAMLSEQRAFLTGDEIEALFRRELEQELARNLGDAFSNQSHSRFMDENARPLAEAYRIARRPDRPHGLTDTDRADLAARGIDRCDMTAIEEYLADFCHAADLRDDDVSERLAAIGVPASRTLLEIARSHILRARAEAWRRTERVFDPAVIDAANPLQALMALGDAPPVKSTEPQVGTDCPFIVFDQRRFSEGIDDIIAELRQEKTWKGDCAQQRRIMGTFAWITGDKRRGAYTHLDVDAFKRGLMRLPKDYQFGAMAVPFAEVVAALPPVTPDKQRHAKTVNRDLSTMSRVSRHLAQTVWKPKQPNTLVLDFAAATLTVKDTGDDPRPPWRKEHLALLFGSPLYTGNDGPLHRLTAAGRHLMVSHDAAYWVPLLCYYHHSCREETCGLRADEVVIDHDVPHFVIQDNDVRGRDGELAGEKRLARRRKLPLHPELIRLGFLDYVRAIRDQGHTALFPELYLHAAKRGGAHFYARAWDHMADWIEDRLPVERNRAGKGPDIHSIRALGASFYEVDGVNEIMRADVMGHARATVNGKHYSKRIATEGLTVVLRERLEFMTRYVPIVTGDLAPAPIRLLPLGQRSRVGSARPRKIRNDAGSSSRRPATLKRG